MTSCPFSIQKACWLGAFALALVACQSPPRSESAAPSASAAARVRFEAPGLTHAAPKRLVAFGDVHGDLDATKRALKLGGAIDDAGAWVGGDLFVVQTGDHLDRGDDDRSIMDLFERLTLEAKAKGGKFVALNGNHELMNAAMDFRYVTEGSLAPFDEFRTDKPELASVPERQRGRAVAFLPGGPYAKKLAGQSLVAIVGDSLFVHGGVLMKHLEYGLERMDGETRAWLRGERRSPPAIVVSEDGPVWTRAYSAAPGREECAALGRVLDALGLKRMVMGHTPQRPGISQACDGRAFRIDTGMSKHYQGRVEVLQIEGGKVDILK